MNLTKLAADIFKDWQNAKIKRLIFNNPNRQRKIGGGRKPILQDLKDQLLLTLIWAKTYSGYLILEYFFNLDESTACRVISNTIMLIQDKFILQDPRKSGRKKIRTIEEFKKLFPELDLDDILADATEQKIPRPEKKLKRNKYHSGRKKAFTLKTQIAADKKGLIIHINKACPGRKHDYKVFQESDLPDIVPENLKLYLDSGYQGVQKDFPGLNSVIPFKRTKNHKILTHSEKIFNHKQRKIRVRVEHAISRLKKYQVLSQTYRHSLRNYDKVFRFVANIVNFRMIERLQTI